MLQIARMGSPSDLAPALERDIRRVERLEKGTALTNAVTFEREKKQRRDRQQQEEMEQRHRSESEHPLHIYTSSAVETDIDEEDSNFNVEA